MNWLFKEEPSNYSYDAFTQDKKTVWSGVKNPVAQLNLRSVKKGASVFYYHTGDEKAIVGIAKAAGDAYPDPKDTSGKAHAVEDPAEKMEALRVITNHIVHGRWEEVRTPNDQEMKATLVLALPLEEVSAKIRSGPPVDDEEDLALPVWAGVIPIRQEVGPAPDPAIDLSRFKRP